MRDTNEQPGNERAEAFGDCGETTTLIADFEQSLGGSAVDILCGVLAKHPTATAADLRELLEAHPTLGGVTLAEVFFESAANTE